MGSHLYNVDISTDVSEVLPLWRSFEENGALTPFQRRAWLVPLFDTLARDMNAEPLFITVSDCDGTPLLFLPLCRWRYFGTRIAQFPDFGVSDYNAPLVLNERPIIQSQVPEMLCAIVRSLKEVDVLRLDKMPATIEGIDNPLVQLKGVQSIAARCWGLDLPSRFAHYNQKTSKKFSKEIQRKIRRIHAQGNVTFAQAITVNEKKEIFNILVRQLRQRCDEKNRFHVLSDKRFLRFYQAMILQDNTSEFVALHALRINDLTVATTLTLRHNQDRLVLITTFESGDWKRYSLGNAVVYKSIEESIEKGDAYFDLTIGNESYKKNFGASSKSLFSVTQPLTFKGFPHAAARRSIIAARKVLEPGAIGLISSPADRWIKSTGILCAKYELRGTVS